MLTGPIKQLRNQHQVLSACGTRHGQTLSQQGQVERWSPHSFHQQGKVSRPTSRQQCEGPLPGCLVDVGYPHRCCLHGIGHIKATEASAAGNELPKLDTAPLECDCSLMRGRDWRESGKLPTPESQHLSTEHTAADARAAPALSSGPGARSLPTPLSLSGGFSRRLPLPSTACKDAMQLLMSRSKARGLSLR